MNFKLAVAIIMAVFVHSQLLGQSETYSVKKAWFSTEKYDEFSPVFYKNGIVFSTNRASKKILSYSTEENKGFIKIDFIESAGSSSQSPRFFSKKLNSKLNDGPVTFSRKGDTIYFSRNIITEGKISEVEGTRNKLGIFYAIFDGTDWTKIREFRFNSEWFNITTPCLSPDGKRLYFASDKPGGFGGTDLYYCQWRNDYWDDPVNMGPVINTKGNESYPFINAAGEFFFSSDGHHGLGGKDIFFSRYQDTSWVEPIGLDAPVNSQYDDFGICTDTLMEQGYFSSNRDKSADIYQFRTIFPQIFYKSLQRENSYCFVLSDSGSIAVDTLNLQYKWSFGDGTSASGAIVSHCFPGPGNFNVKLEIVDRVSKRLFFTELEDELEIRDFQQAYINSPEYAVKGEIVPFDGLKSYLPGYKTLSYSWDFGDKVRMKGDKVTHSFAVKGNYDVNLELALRSDTNGLIKKTGISKKIIVFDNVQEVKSFNAKKVTDKNKLPDLKNATNANIISRYSAEAEFKKDVVFRIELLSSKNKLDIKGGMFKDVPEIYTVSERYDPLVGEYSYSVDQQLNLMATYPGYMRMFSLGFVNARSKMVVLTEPAEKELNNLIRINGAFADTYFDYSGRLTSNAFIMLDQLVRLMNKYPALRLEIAVHTDNTGTAENNLAVSQKQAQTLVDYLINRGIGTKRLVARGFGESKSIAPNILEKDRRLNRRIDFIIVK